jgi:hypothetical protein
MWVIGRYKGDQAKRVKSLADEGVGYFIRQESGKGMTYEVEAAFRIEGELPPHLIACTPEQSWKLEELRKQRQGLRGLTNS